jgi:GPH family glycoside/pentoside/hexuronide:cation symporter
MDAVLARNAGVLPRYGLFAGFLAFAGLPIYIHAPKFFVDEYGVSLAAIGGVLLVLRLIDFVQDPLLGRLVDRLGSCSTRCSGSLSFWPCCSPASVF